MTQREFVQWLCGKTSRVDAPEASEIFRQLLDAEPEFKLKLVAAISKPKK